MDEMPISPCTGPDLSLELKATVKASKLSLSGTDLGLLNSSHIPGSMLSLQHHPVLSMALFIQGPLLGPGKASHPSFHLVLSCRSLLHQHL